METPEILAIIAIVLIVGLALFYVIRTKKKGKKCIGCPYSKTCKSHKNTDSNSCCNCEGK